MSEFRQVGEFPSPNAIKRRTIRAPINPMDKSTVISIHPKEIEETKHTIQPSKFIIPPGSFENPSILVVGPSSWWRDIDEDQPLLEIPVSSIQIADSIVKDYCNGIFGCNMSDIMPGLAYLPGEFTVEKIKKDHPKLLESLKKKQDNWYAFLVKAADSLWARSNGNPLAVSDDMRLAANELGIQQTKDWMKHHQMMEMVRCMACGSLKNPDYPVCATCKAIDVNHPSAKNVKFAS